MRHYYYIVVCVCEELKSIILQYEGQETTDCRLEQETGGRCRCRWWWRRGWPIMQIMVCCFFGWADFRLDSTSIIFVLRHETNRTDKWNERMKICFFFVVHFPLFCNYTWCVYRKFEEEMFKFSVSQLKLQISNYGTYSYLSTF